MLLAMRWFFLVALFSTAAALTVFVAPHTHLDLDWLYPFDAYWDRRVRFAGDTVLQNLLLQLSGTGERRVFNWCETSYLARWWAERDATTREMLASLVREKRFGFVGGGWAQNDEGVTNWEHVVDNMAIGHRWIERTFGQQFVPRVSWQIDPFGASAAVAWLFSSFVDYHVIDRVDYALKQKWIAEKALEFEWSGGVFTHCLEEHYSSPQGFDFEGSEEGNPQINRENLAARAEVLIRDIRRRASYFRTDNLLLLFGDDFRFVNADKMYLNMDYLMAEINSKNASTGVTMRYSLPIDYFQAIDSFRKPLAEKWPTFDGNTDLFPYRKSVAYQWYTGYYTTRPQEKSAIVVLLSAVRAAGMLVAGTRGQGDEETRKLLQEAQETAARTSHHDTVTGTSANWTVAHMASVISIARDQAETAARRALGAPLAIEREISQLPTWLFAVNSLAWQREELLCFPVSLALRRVPIVVRSTPSQRSVNGDTLCILASLPPMATATFFAEMGKAEVSSVFPAVPGGVWRIANRFISAEFDSGSGELVQVDNLKISAKFEVFNTSSDPNSYMSNRYFSVFNATKPESVFADGLPKAFRVDGPLFSEVVSEIDSRNLTLTFRVFSDAVKTRELGGYLQIIAHVGPIAWNNDLFLSLFPKTVGEKSAAVFATDQNGLFLRNRQTYCETCTSGGLLQPGTVFAKLGNLALFADRPHAYLTQDGKLLAGLHRRFNCTNSVVLNEPLNDTSVIDANFFLTVSENVWQKKSLLISNPPLQLISSVFFSSPNSSLCVPNVPETLHATLSIDSAENESFLRMWSFGSEMPPAPERVLIGARGKKRVPLNRVGEERGEMRPVECYMLEWK